MKDNKFLTGFLILVVLGAGALGFFLFQAKGKYTEASDAYASKISELQSLQASKPFPEQANLKRMQDLQTAHQGVIDRLQKELAAAEFPVKELRPNEFQDKLKQSVDRVHQAAASKGVELPTQNERFALGFDRYLTEPPNEKAAAPLGRMLEAVENVVLKLIDTAPNSIKDLKRTPLAEENTKTTAAPATPAPRGASPAAARKDAAPTTPLVQRYPFEIEFTAHEPKVRNFLNEVVADKKQFYIPAAISIVNEQAAGPSKVASADGSSPSTGAPADPAAAPADPAAAGATAEGAGAPKFIVGEERLNVAVRIEIADFAEPPAPKAPASAKKSAQ